MWVYSGVMWSSRLLPWGNYSRFSHDNHRENYRLDWGQGGEIQRKSKLMGQRRKRKGGEGVTARTKKHYKSSQTIKTPGLAPSRRREEVKYMRDLELLHHERHAVSNSSMEGRQNRPFWSCLILTPAGQCDILRVISLSIILKNIDSDCKIILRNINSGNGN